MGSWMHRHRRLVAVMVLGLWIAPALFFAVLVVVFGAASYPGLVGAAALAVVWLSIRLRRKLRSSREVPDAIS